MLSIYVAAGKQDDRGKPRKGLAMLTLVGFFITGALGKLFSFPLLWFFKYTLQFIWFSPSSPKPVGSKPFAVGI